MAGEETEFERDLASLINRHSKDNDSNTPDFILARFLHGCFLTFVREVRAREQWYGVELRPGRVIIKAMTPEEYAAQVEVDHRVHATMYIAGKSFDTVHAIVAAAYADGLAAGRAERQ